MSRASDLRKQRREQYNPVGEEKKRGAGYSGSVLNLPEGLRFWKPKGDTEKIDIVPYVVGDFNPINRPGQLHFCMSYYVYSNVGAEKARYLAPCKYGKRDPIQEEKERYLKENGRPVSDEQKKIVGSLSPSLRQLFLIWDHKEKEKGVQLWDVSHYYFGGLLTKTIDMGEEYQAWDQFWYPDEGGYTLKIGFEDKGTFGIKANTIVFVDRQGDLPENVVKHSFVLDDMVVETPYEKLKAIFYQEDVDDVDHSSEDRQESSSSASSEVVNDSPQATKEDAPEPKREAPVEQPVSKSTPTADDYGLSRGDDIIYQGRKASIAKISPDGTSLTLIDEETDDVIKAVGADEVSKEGDSRKDETKTETDDKPTTVEAKSEDAPFSDDDVDWEGDWDT